MKITLTDEISGRTFEIIYKSQYLPALGEDGFEYLIFTQSLLDCGKPRTDCTIVDLKNHMAIKRFNNTLGEPQKYRFDKRIFAKAQSIEEYCTLLKQSEK